MDELTHEVLIRSFHGNFVLEEVDPDEDLCLVHRGDHDYFAEGSTRVVVSAATGLDQEDPWVEAVIQALDRERKWVRWGRRNQLEVRLGREYMYHVSASANRESIRRYGLDWRRMGAAPGVAGSTTPELPGVFLQDYADDDFFVAMARFPTDMWEVDVRDLWLESGPSGWWVASTPIGPNRVSLLAPRHQATDS